MGGSFSILNKMATTKKQFSDSEGDTTFTGEQSTSYMTSTTFDTTSSRLNATRIELERRQLTHSIQLLKLEVSQKDMVIEALKTDHTNNMDELEEKLSDVTCERNLLAQKLRAMTHVYEEELKELRTQANKPITTATVCTSCQRADSHTSSRSGNESDILMGADDLKTTLSKPLLSENEYREMVNSVETELDIKELIRVKLFEASRPFIQEADSLRREAQHLTDRLSEKEELQSGTEKLLQDTRAEASRLTIQCDELTHINQTLSSNIKHTNYKTDNFDTIKRERDELQREMDAIRRSFVEKEIKEKVMEDERRKMQEELSLAQQSVALLKQDKDYLSRQHTDTSTRCREVEERNRLLLEQLSAIKQSKEELYEQFIKTRQQQKDDYGQQLTDELDTIRAKTSLEIEHVRVHTREMYERENRVLMDTKERADNDRDKMEDKLKEMEEKYDTLMTEFRQLQLSSEGQISDLQSELQMKVFECERIHLLQQETSRTLTGTQRERNKYMEKTECLSEDIRRLTTDTDSKIREYEASLKDTTQRLHTYESLEQELDDVVMQAANMESEQDAERVLFSFGFGTSVPSTSRRRMQQSVQLARRVLKLERINASLRQQLESFDKEKRALEEKVNGMSTLLGMSQQPQQYLVESLQSRDSEITAVKNRNMALEARIRELEQDSVQLMETSNQMSMDLERLLNHNQELNVMKNMLLALHKDTPITCSDKPVAMDTKNTHPQPQPMIFTR